MLLKINERKRWTDPPPQDATARAAQDEEIFQTARLIKYVIGLENNIDQCCLLLALAADTLCHSFLATTLQDA